jgi:hypothetical protein
MSKLGDMQKLDEMLKLVDELLKAGDEQGLFLGLGYTNTLPRSKQEGPKVTRLRKLRDELLKS